MNIVLTSHVLEKIERRKLVKQEVIDAVKQPDNITKKYGKYYYQKKIDRGTIEIPCEVTETYIKVITVYWT